MNINIIKALTVLFFVSSCFSQVTVTQSSTITSINHFSGAGSASATLVELKIANNGNTPQQLTQIRTVVLPHDSGVTKLIAYRDNHNETSTNIGETTEFSSHIIPVSLTLPPNETEVVRIQGEFAPNGNKIVQARVDSIQINGNTEISSSGIFGSKQYLFGSPVANFFLVEEPTITVAENAGVTDSMTVKFKFEVLAWGGDISKPTADDFVVMAGRNKFAPDIRCNTVVVTTIPDGNIMDGNTATVTVQAMLNASQVTKRGTYGFAVKQIHWSEVGSTSGIDQYWGLERVGSSTQEQFNAGNILSAPVRTAEIHYSFYDLISGLKSGGESSEPYQVYGEGGILHFSPVGVLDRMQTGYVVVPSQSNQMLAFLLKPGLYSYNNQTFAPKILKAIDLNLTIFEEGVPQNMITLIINDIEVEKTFDVVFEGVVCHCKMERIGDGSFLTRIFWGINSSYNSPGDTVDRADLSPSIPIPNKERMPQRFTLSLGPPEKYQPIPTLFRFEVVSIPGAFKLQGSADLKNWVDLSFGWGAGDPRDSNGTSVMILDIDTGSLGYPLPQNIGFFRLAVE